MRKLVLATLLAALPAMGSASTVTWQLTGSRVTACDTLAEVERICASYLGWSWDGTISVTTALMPISTTLSFGGSPDGGSFSDNWSALHVDAPFWGPSAWASGVGLTLWLNRDWTVRDWRMSVDADSVNYTIADGRLWGDDYAETTDGFFTPVWFSGDPGRLELVGPAPAPIPLPGGLALIMAGSAGLLLVGKRSRG